MELQSGSTRTMGEIERLNREEEAHPPESRDADGGRVLARDASPRSMLDWGC